MFKHEIGRSAADIARTVGTRSNARWRNPIRSIYDTEMSKSLQAQRRRSEPARPFWASNLCRGTTHCGLEAYCSPFRYQVVSSNRFAAKWR